MTDDPGSPRPASPGIAPVAFEAPREVVAEPAPVCQTPTPVQTGIPVQAPCPPAVAVALTAPAVRSVQGSPAPVWNASIWILPRDPFTVVVHWDLPAPVMELAKARDPQGSWRFRVWQEFVGGRRVTDQELPPNTTHRFVPVIVPGASYVAELGFLESSGHWRGCALSQPVAAPRETDARDARPSIWREAPMTRLPDHAGPVHPVMLLGSAPDRRNLTATGQGVPAAGPHGAAGDSTTRDSREVIEALQRIVHRESRSIPTGSSDQTVEWSDHESVNRNGSELRPVMTDARDRVSSTAWLTDSPGPGSSASLPPSSSDSAQPAGVDRGSGFWFRINAEVILYGSTERDARLTIAGRPVALREDGSFSFRFLLPDGRFDLPVVAVNATGTDGRSAAVTFSRATSVRGEVGVHPAAAGLKPPVPDAI